MKAKDYAKEFYDNPTDETLANIARKFVIEVNDIAKARNAATNEAMTSIFDEQDRKWRAFARLVDGVRPEGFRLVVKKHFPFVYTVWTPKRYENH